MEANAQLRDAVVLRFGTGCESPRARYMGPRALWTRCSWRGIQTSIFRSRSVAWSHTGWGAPPPLLCQVAHIVTIVTWPLFVVICWLLGLPAARVYQSIMNRKWCCEWVAQHVHGGTEENVLCVASRPVPWKERGRVEKPNHPSWGSRPAQPPWQVVLSCHTSHLLPLPWRNGGCDALNWGPSGLRAFLAGPFTEVEGLRSLIFWTGLPDVSRSVCPVLHILPLFSGVKTASACAFISKACWVIRHKHVFTFCMFLLWGKFTIYK